MLAQERRDKEIRKLTDEELALLCSKWQEKLRLSHWDIAVRVCKAKDMPLKGVQAANEISLTNEQALISVLDSDDYPASVFAQDMEVSLVHELLHIPLKYVADPDRETLEYVHMEAFIEGLARLLVSLSRREGTE